MIIITTDRLRLIAGTEALAEAEIRDKKKFANLLGASVPASWPPDNLKDVQDYFLALYKEHPEYEGWLTWYTVRIDKATPILCGGIGFKGQANQQGMVEIGYSVLPEYQGEGLATEMTGGILNWAKQQPSVKQIEAEAVVDNRASIRVLEKNNFLPIGPGFETNTIRFRYQP